MVKNIIRLLYSNNIIIFANKLNNLFFMKKTLLSIGLFVASIVGVNAQITYAPTESITLQGGYVNQLSEPGDIVGTLTSITLSAILDASLAETYADDLTILVTSDANLDANTVVVFQGGGYSNFGALEKKTWANGASEDPGTEVSGTINLTNPINFTANPDYIIWIGNGYTGAGSQGTWSNINVLFDGVSLAGASVGENLASNFIVSPNPTSDVVNISSSLNTNLTQVNVIDLNGRTVKAFNLGGVANAQINIGDLSSGVYMLNITSEEGTTTKKIVKN